MDWMLYYGLISLGVAIGVSAMAIVSICREPDEQHAYRDQEDEADGRR